MKKNLLYLISLSLLLASCNHKSEPLTILSPTGAPSIAFYNYATNENFQTNANPANIVTSMNDNGSDIIVIDTIKGISAINDGAPYTLAANITFGNFFIAATGNDDNNKLDKDDVIVNFGVNQTPQKVFELLYGSDYTNIIYVDNVSMAAKCLQSKKTLDNAKDVDYVFIAEPILTASLNINKDATIYANIQDEYKKKTDKALIQAGIFVKNSSDHKAINEFLSNLNDDINHLLADSSLITKTAQEMGEESFTAKFSINANMVKNTINKNNSIGLGFKYAFENYEAIDEFCKLFNVTINEKQIYKK